MVIFCAFCPSTKREVADVFITGSSPPIGVCLKHYTKFSKGKKLDVSWDENTTLKELKGRFREAKDL